MKVKQMRVNGFKNIKDTVLDFSSTIALIGLNNYGKTNLINALQKFSNIFQLNNIEILNDYFSNKVVMSEEGIQFLLEFEYLDKDYKYELNYTRNKNINETFSCKDKVKFSKLIERMDNKILYKSKLSSDRLNIKSEFFEDQKYESVIKKLSYIDSLDYQEVLIKLLNFDIINLPIHTVKSTPIYKKNVGRIDLQNGEYYEELAYLLNERHPDKYQKLKSLFLDLMPDIDDISVYRRVLNMENNDMKISKETDLIYGMYAIEKGSLNPTKFEDLSLGTKRIFVLLLIILFFEEEEQIIVLEELENSFHPRLFKEFLNNIDKLLKDSKVGLIITSHSPYLIDYMDLNSVYIGIPNEKKVAKFVVPTLSGQRKIKKYTLDSRGKTGEVVFDLLLDDIETNDLLKEIVGDKVWKNLY